MNDPFLYAVAEILREAGFRPKQTGDDTFPMLRVDVTSKDSFSVQVWPDKAVASLTSGICGYCNFDMAEPDFDRKLAERARLYTKIIRWERSKADLRGIFKAKNYTGFARYAVWWAGLVAGRPLLTQLWGFTLSDFSDMIHDVYSRFVQETMLMQGKSEQEARYWYDAYIAEDQE